MELVFDIGGTNIRLALVEGGRLGKVVRLHNDVTPAGFQEFLTAVRDLTAGKRLVAAAGGFPGQIEGEEGRLVLTRNLTGWLNSPIKAELREILKCPVHVANDVVLAGIGEAHAGAGRSRGVMVYYTVSTGVNAVRLVNGQVDETISRYELGYQIIDVHRGKAGSLEDLTGGRALERRTGRLPREVQDEGIWAELEGYLAAGLYNTVLHWNPELVVLGGSMMRDLKVDRISEALAKYPPVFERWPRLVQGTLGDEAGLVGAMAWLEQLGTTRRPG